MVEKEYANVILLNKKDGVKKKGMRKVEEMVRMINEKAEIFKTYRSSLDLNEILGAKVQFDYQKISQNSSVLSILNQKKLKFPSHHFIFAEKKAFHPLQLQLFLEKEGGWKKHLFRCKVQKPFFFNFFNFSFQHFNLKYLKNTRVSFGLPATKKIVTCCRE